LTAAGHPRSTFTRAIEYGILLVAEATLRVEIPQPTLTELLETVGGLCRYPLATRTPGVRGSVAGGVVT
jgi:hypothetical protein